MVCPVKTILCFKPVLNTIVFFADFAPYMDHTLEEFLMTHSGLIVNESIALCNRLTDRDIPNINAPPSHDWTKYNVVTPVKDQKECNSCYAFSATGT